MDFMWAENMVDGGRFVGLQPGVKFKTGLRPFVPDVPRFTMHGMIVTESAGEHPFVVNAGTELVMSQHSRPQRTCF